MALAFKFDNVQVTLKPNGVREWLGYPSVDGQPQAKYYLQVTELRDCFISAICQKGRAGSLRSFDRLDGNEATLVAMKALAQFLKGEPITVPPVSRMNPPRPIVPFGE